MKKKYLMISLIITTSFFIILHAWVGDDAFITFRYVDNILQGNGPVFNAGERVQGYTHPLWLGLLLIGGWLGLDLYYWSLFLGLLFNGLTIYYFHKLVLKSKYYHHAMLFLVISLFSSTAFIDFQSSGLENPLTYFLILMILYNLKKPLHTVLWSSLLLINRLDHVFMAAPFIIYSLIRKRKSLLGLLPIIAWELFAITYYGFPFPNTKYAKLNGIQLIQGFKYLADYLFWEPLSSLLFIISSWLIYQQGSKKSRLILAAVSLQLIYSIMIGGDFMRGRFILSSIFLTITYAAIIISKKGLKLKKEWLTILIILLVLNYLRASNVELTVNEWGIANERLFYLKETGLINTLLGTNNSTLQQRGLEIKEKDYDFLRTPNPGIMGYYAGTDVLIIDVFGLNDAFIARLPVDNSNKQRIGHLARSIPNEYLIEKQQGITQEWSDHELKGMWEDLKIITQGPVLSIERFNTMINFWLEYGV